MWGSKIILNKKQIHGGFFVSRLEAHKKSIEMFENLTGTKWKSKIEKRLNPDRIEDCLQYIPETGELFWKKPVNRRRKDLIGKPAGFRHHSGYQHLEFQGKYYSVHRICFYLYHGYWPKYHIDHINGDRNDNRISNLRDVPRSINAQNQKEHREGKLWGALWLKNVQKWSASFTLHGKTHYFGNHATEYEAHCAAKEGFKKISKEIKL